MTENNNLLFEHSPWWILACCALGLLYAFLLYQKKSTWSTLTNRILFSIRFLLVSFLAILLLSPFLRLVLNQVEEPIFVLALDNSTSVASGLDSTQLLAVSRQVDQLAAALGAKDITVERRNLNNEDLSKFEGTPFDQKTTDLSTLLREWQTEFEGRAFAGALIVSDGIYNKGMAPQYLNFTGKVYTLGVGDTIPVKDLILNNVQFNKIAYQGNLFPVRAEVINQGIETGELEVSILKDGKIISTQRIKGGGGELLNADFQVPAEQKGLQHYVVQVSNHPEETILSNNQQDIYIDIVEGKEKILIASGAPHPDIKALKAAISKNENYQVKTYVPMVDKELPTDVFDLVILISPFERQRRLAALLERVKNENMSAWYVLGSTTLWAEANNQNTLFKVERTRNESDQVRPAYNDAFQLFTFESEWKGIVNSYYTPVTVPYGDYQISGGVAVALFQKVGAITTPRPMWFFSQNQLPKQAVTLGEGLWQWRMQEYSRTDNYVAFDNLVLKTVQYLSSKEDKRKFRVYTTKTEFFDNEQIIFQTETYNDVFEPIYGTEVELKLTYTDGSVTNYNYTTAPGNTRFRLNGLKDGIYKFEASAIVNGNRELASGQFTIRKLDLENLQLTANFNVLRELSASTGGKFYAANQVNAMIADLTALQPKGRIYSSENYLPIIHLWWIFTILLVLLSAEWFTRKYSGSY
ncbi:MAG: hypothetical protein RIB71_12180 [Imperialibacter sp.]|uniref:DUF3488 domain-containing protein n=1 Tax=Imperialibacter sp. TaxID=2038411 RepID=UPI0032EF83D7